jgi:hypothetical protein
MVTWEVPNAACRPWRRFRSHLAELRNIISPCPSTNSATSGLAGVMEYSEVIRNFRPGVDRSGPRP